MYPVIVVKVLELRMAVNQPPALPVMELVKLEASKDFLWLKEPALLVRVMA